MESYKPTYTTPDKDAHDEVSIASVVNALLSKCDDEVACSAETQKPGTMYLIAPNIDGIILL